MTTPRIETSSAWIWLDEHGIMHALTKPGVHETLEIAVENMKALMVAVGSKKRPLLVDARALLSHDKAAADYYRGGLNSMLLTSIAYVIPSKFGSLIGNLFAPKKWSVPMKLFNDDAAALQWLQSHQELAKDRNPAQGP